MGPSNRSDSCKDVFAVLSAYLDLELPPDACEKIRAHIAGCQPCVAFVESLQKTIELCRQYQPSNVPEPISTQAREELMAAYRKASARPQHVSSPEK